jgi:hypothetical protein
VADRKITDHTALTGAGTASGDLIEIVDVSDTTDDATGTNKKQTVAEHATALGRLGAAALRPTLEYSEFCVTNLTNYFGRYANMPRNTCPATDLAALTSGTILLTGIALPAGLVIDRLTAFSGATALASSTNQWMVLTDIGGAVLAKTASVTSAWAANARKTFTIATDAADASISSYTIPSTDLYFVGIMVAATTVPSLRGAQVASTVLLNLILALNGTADTGQTTPAACPDTLAAITTTVNVPYVEVGSSTA